MSISFTSVCQVNTLSLENRGRFANNRLIEEVMAAATERQSLRPWQGGCTFSSSCHLGLSLLQSVLIPLEVWCPHLNTLCTNSPAQGHDRAPSTEHLASSILWTPDSCSSRTHTGKAGGCPFTDVDSVMQKVMYLIKDAGLPPAELGPKATRCFPKNSSWPYLLCEAQMKARQPEG